MFTVMTFDYVSLFGLDVRLEAAIISAGVAFLTALITPLIRHQFDRRLQTYQLRTEHEYAQRRALKRLIGSFHGRLVEAADLFHLRMLNLYLHRGEDWLDVTEDDYGSLERYYFHSSVLRFLTLLSLATRFENSAFFIESEFGSKRDVRFLFFAKAIRWTATDTDLFARVDPPYNVSEATDHFYTDHLGEMCTLIIEKKDTEKGLFRFTDMVRETKGGRLRPALEFFQGLSPNERHRLRWDRLVAFHLVVMSFLNEFGYEEQGSSSELFVMVANQIRDPQIAENLLALLERLGLQEHTKDIAVASKQITPGVADPFDYRLLDGGKLSSSGR